MKENSKIKTQISTFPDVLRNNANITKNSTISNEECKMKN